MKRFTLLALSLTALLCGSCSDLVVARPVVIAPHAQPSPQLFDRLVSAATAQGYQIALAQPNRSRFAARAHYTDEHGGYVLAVEWRRDGSVSITPGGPRVERAADSQIIVPVALRDEMFDLANALDRAARGG